MTIFLSMMAKALVMGLYAAITGREMFPANPKGPLYRWFGQPKGASANHAEPPAPLVSQQHGRAAELYAERQILLPAPRPDA